MSQPSISDERVVDHVTPPPTPHAPRADVSPFGTWAHEEAAGRTSGAGARRCGWVCFVAVVAQLCDDDDDRAEKRKWARGSNYIDILIDSFTSSGSSRFWWFLERLGSDPISSRQKIKKWKRKHLYIDIYLRMNSRRRVHFGLLDRFWRYSTDIPMTRMTENLDRRTDEFIRTLIYSAKERKKESGQQTNNTERWEIVQWRH